LQEYSRRQTIEFAALIVVMIAVGVAGWSLQMVPRLRVDTSPLADFPTEIGGWQSTDISMELAVERELDADFHIQRSYVRRLTEPLWLYVGYYSTERGGRPEHTPRGCYTGAGWGIESSQTVKISSVADFRANEYLVEQGGERRLVHFWYRSHRRTGILGGLDQNIDRLLGRLLNNRADGALVRISTPIVGDDTTAARGRLLSFASLIDPLFDRHWPTESPCLESQADDCLEDRAALNKDATGAGKTLAPMPTQLAGSREVFIHQSGWTP
jgi:EpsI family protein